NDTATTEIYTLSLHDALPIFQAAVMADLVDIDIGELTGVLLERVLPVLPLRVAGEQELLFAGLDQENDARVVERVILARTMRSSWFPRVCLRRCMNQRFSMGMARPVCTRARGKSSRPPVSADVAARKPQKLAKCQYSSAFLALCETTSAFCL